MKSWYIHIIPAALMIGLLFGYYACGALGAAMEIGIWVWIAKDDPPWF